ncbi:hypothetical protein Salat_0099600 [Sesamum alatum]|uniref:Uncharacterized protein n=1 Tax=Sesamum alatum TaxID=300844 RepID=A0AAE1YXS6_9LAMI|nr:hypothetical protein Salat_0099600 [Sesamum alatum]
MTFTHQGTERPQRLNPRPNGQGDSSQLGDSIGGRVSLNRGSPSEIAVGHRVGCPVESKDIWGHHQPYPAPTTFRGGKRRAYNHAGNVRDTTTPRAAKSTSYATLDRRASPLAIGLLTSEEELNSELLELELEDPLDSLDISKGRQRSYLLVGEMLEKHKGIENGCRSKARSCGHLLEVGKVGGNGKPYL